MNTNDLPTISSYGKYSSENYGVNSLMVNLRNLRLYYSYSTIVAYADNIDGLVCSQNAWTVTTGKHLNWIQPDKSKRVNYYQFNEMLTAALARHIV